MNRRNRDSSHRSSYDRGGPGNMHASYTYHNGNHIGGCSQYSHRAVQLKGQVLLADSSVAQAAAEGIVEIEVEMLGRP